MGGIDPDKVCWEYYNCGYIDSRDCPPLRKCSVCAGEGVIRLYSCHLVDGEWIERAVETACPGCGENAP